MEYQEPLKLPKIKMIFKRRWIQNLPWFYFLILFHILVNELPTFSFYFCNSTTWLLVVPYIYLCLSAIRKEKYHSMCHYVIGIPSVNKHLLCVYFVPSPLGIAQWKRQPLRNSLSSVGEHRKQTIAIKCDKNWNGENT